MVVVDSNGSALYSTIGESRSLGKGEKVKKS